MANVDIQLGYKNAAFFAANPTLILEVGQMIYLEQTGTYKIGDGVTQLSVLSFLGQLVVFKDLSISTVLTGTTAITLMKSILIPANTVNVDDVIQIITRALRSTATGIASQFLYYNTTASLTGATLVATQTATMGYGALKRHLFVRASNDSETIDVTFNSSNDDSTAPTITTISNINIDWTSNVYIIQAYKNAANGDSTTSRGMVITRFR